MSLVPVESIVALKQNGRFLRCSTARLAVKLENKYVLCCHSQSPPSFERTQRKPFLNFLQKLPMSPTHPPTKALENLSLDSQSRMVTTRAAAARSAVGPSSGAIITSRATGFTYDLSELEPVAQENAKKWLELGKDYTLSRARDLSGESSYIAFQCEYEKENGAVRLFAAQAADPKVGCMRCETSTGQRLCEVRPAILLSTLTAWPKLTVSSMSSGCSTILTHGRLSAVLPSPWNSKPMGPLSASRFPMTWY